MMISLVCSRKGQSSLGRVLIEMAEEYAKSKNIVETFIDSLPEPKLLSYYKSLGYELMPPPRGTQPNKESLVRLYKVLV